MSSRNATAGDELFDDIERLDKRKRISADLATPLTLQFEMVRTRTRGTLVGMEEYEYLIIRINDSIESIASRFFKGNTVVVQYVHEGTLYGFQSQTLGSVAVPARLLFVSYPRIVSEQNLRVHQRVLCYLPATVDADGQAHDIIVVDVSAGGCQVACALDVESGNADPVLPRDSSVSVNLALPGVSDPLVLAGIVKNHRPHDDRDAFGIAFDGLDEATLATLNSYLQRTRSLPQWT
jgi:hypothetical protein